MNIYLNNAIVSEQDASISVSDAGFLYGSGLFETMRAQQGVVFGIKFHLNRLYNSANELGFNLNKAPEDLIQAVYDLLKANDLTDARIRLTLSAGAPDPDDDKPDPTILITAVPLVPYAKDCYDKGILAILCPFRQNPADPLAGHKSTSYFNRMLGLRKAHEQQAAEALWFTTDGYLAEGCVSNVFLVKDNCLLTPPLGTPVLPGIARQTVCELAKANQIALEEKALTIDDLLKADEVFITNVIMKVMPVVHIEQHAVGNASVGPVTQQLMGLLDEAIAFQCRSLS